MTNGNVNKKIQTPSQAKIRCVSSSVTSVTSMYGSPETKSFIKISPRALATAKIPLKTINYLKLMQI